MSGDTLASARRLAEQLARTAGATLRTEFLRPGGPRGAGAHADVDAEVEHALREALTAAYPTHSFLGEETGAHGDPHARYCWVVDPNDGTSAYLRGERSSAVSIALLCDHVPVVGIVLAPLQTHTPEGDLFAWHQGGTLERNGAPCVPRARQGALAPGDLVALSSGADASVKRNLELTHPARFLRVPSLAYRLALVAVDDAQGAVSLGGPAAWDVAGGHALLRGAGRTLVDADGSEWRYDQPHRASNRSFAGSLEVTAQLRARDWQRVLSADARDEDDTLTRALYTPPSRPGRALADAALLSRAQGCLLGQLAGDALGALVEFESSASITQKYPDGVRDLADGGTWNTLAGQPTDDSEMALVSARSLLVHERFSPAQQLDAYRAWLASRPFDLGGTTRAALTGTPQPLSQANGALMRASTIALFAALRSEHDAAAYARDDAALTHPNRACLDANALFCVAIGHAIRTGISAAALHAFALAYARAQRLEPLVLECLEQSREGPPREYQRQQGWVRIALHNAFYQLAHAPSLEEALVDTVGRGGDTDTNAAIAGALLGAVYGRNAIPRAWRLALASCRPAVGVGSVVHPRPRVFWPVDAEALAEALVCVGRDAEA